MDVTEPPSAFLGIRTRSSWRACTQRGVAWIEFRRCPGRDHHPPAALGVERLDRVAVVDTERLQNVRIGVARGHFGALLVGRPPLQGQLSGFSGIDGSEFEQRGSPLTSQPIRSWRFRRTYASGVPGTSSVRETDRRR